MFFKNKKANGFTLIELLIVVVIIGVLAGMVFVMIQGVIESARMARSKSFARSIQRQLALNEVGVWRFDDDPQPGVEDGVHDASGRGNHGTFSLGPNGTGCAEGSWREGVFGKAICFDGVDDYVDAGNDASIQLGYGSFTIEAWVKPSALGVFDTFIGSGRSLHTAWKMAGWTLGFVGEGRPGLVIGDGTTAIKVQASAISTTHWYHVVGIRDTAADEIKIYINGELGATPVTDTTTGSLTSGANIWVGQRSDAMNEPYGGLIDEPRIYNRALEVYEIQYRYVKGIESLLARGLIDQEEFNNRMAEIEKNLVAK